MKLSINNFKGCRKANININGLTFLSGTGFAGKTSIGKAVSICASLVPKFRGNKETLATIGGKASKIEIESDDYSVWVKYPKGEVNANCNPMSDQYTSGLTSFLNTNTDTRRQFLQETTKSIPTKKDLRNYISSKISDKVIDALWEKIEINGFDAMLDTANNKGKEYKYEWKRITGQQFPSRGTKAADEWLKQNKAYLETEDKTQEISRLKIERMDLIKNEAISESEFAKLKNESSGKSKLEEQLPDMRMTISSLNESIEKMQNEIAEYKYINCVKCGEKNYLDLPEQKQKNLHDVIARKTQIETEQTSIYNQIKKCEEAEKKIREIKVNAVDNTAQIQAIDEQIQNLENVMHNKKTYESAKKIYDSLVGNLEIQESLKPSGVRNDCLMRGLEIFRNTLQYVSEKIGIDKISIDDDMVFYIGNRSEYDLSTSENWILNHSIQLSFARLKTTPQIIFLDEVGGLFDSVRIGLIKLCKEMTGEGHRIIIAITHFNKVRCENLIKAKHMPAFGENHYWVEKGMAV